MCDDINTPERAEHCAESSEWVTAGAWGEGQRCEGQMMRSLRCTAEVEL